MKLVFHLTNLSQSVLLEKVVHETDLVDVKLISPVTGP